MSGATARIAPFAVYLAFLAMAAVPHGMAAMDAWPDAWAWGAAVDLWVYPLKTVAVLGLLIYFWPCYDELRRRPVAGRREAWLSVATGVLVYLSWIALDWPWAVYGASPGYDPYRAGEDVGVALAAIRLFGAAAVVPVMEELFWRSFLIRYLITPRFQTVALGTLSPFSVALSIGLFAIEHDRWLAGLVAGAAYTMLLYRTQRLWPCIVAHGVTNLLLGLYVLSTHNWRYW